MPAALVVAVDPDAPTGELSRLDICHVPTDTASGPLVEVAAARVPLEVSERGRVRVFRPLDAAEEHYAVEIGGPDRSLPVLCRLHSACFTGDVSAA